MPRIPTWISRFVRRKPKAPKKPAAMHKPKGPVKSGKVSRELKKEVQRLIYQEGRRRIKELADKASRGELDYSSVMRKIANLYAEFAENLALKAKADKKVVDSIRNAYSIAANALFVEFLSLKRKPAPTKTLIDIIDSVLKRGYNKLKEMDEKIRAGRASPSEVEDRSLLEATIRAFEEFRLNFISRDPTKEHSLSVHPETARALKWGAIKVKDLELSSAADPKLSQLFGFYDEKFFKALREDYRKVFQEEK